MGAEMKFALQWIYFINPVALPVKDLSLQHNIGQDASSKGSVRLFLSATFILDRCVRIGIDNKGWENAPGTNIISRMRIGIIINGSVINHCHILERDNYRGTQRSNQM